MWRIQIKEGGNWVTLGGRFGEEVGDRIAQFKEHYTCRAEAKNPRSSLVCKREFRTVRE